MCIYLLWCLEMYRMCICIKYSPGWVVLSNLSTHNSQRKACVIQCRCRGSWKGRRCWSYWGDCQEMHSHSERHRSWDWWMYFMQVILVLYWNEVEHRSNVWNPLCSHLTLYFLKLAMVIILYFGIQVQPLIAAIASWFPTF